MNHRKTFVYTIVTVALIYLMWVMGAYLTPFESVIGRIFAGCVIQAIVTAIVVVTDTVLLKKIIKWMND